MNSPRPLFPHHTAAILGATLAAAIVALPGANAEPGTGAHRTPASCFYITQLGPMRPDGSRAIYSRVSGQGVVRFDLSPSCYSLDGNAEGIVVRAINSGSICGASDLDITVRDTHERCFIRSIDRLSPDEAAALPKALLP